MAHSLHLQGLDKPVLVGDQYRATLTSLVVMATVQEWSFFPSCSPQPVGVLISSGNDAAVLVPG